MNQIYASDVKKILSYRNNNGDDYWTTPDKKLLKGAPFSTIESTLLLLELGMDSEEEVLLKTKELLFSVWRKDGRFKLMPNGGIYPCQTALAVKTLCLLGYAADERVQTSFQHLLETQQPDGGWKCTKYSFGRGPETVHSTPYTTLVALDAFRQAAVGKIEDLNRAVEFLLAHWESKAPISPCHYGIGTLFMQIEYPFRGYNLFYYLYVLSFYDYARKDSRFKEALEALETKLILGEIPVERVVPKLSQLTFCRKGHTSKLATKRYMEIMHNLNR